jgi:hypothetical protein
MILSASPRFTMAPPMSGLHHPPVVTPRGRWSRPTRTCCGKL